MFSEIAVISLQQLVQQKFKLIYNDSIKRSLEVTLLLCRGSPPSPASCSPPPSSSPSPTAPSTQPPGTPANIFHGSKYFLLPRYAGEVCSLLAAVSRLDSVRELEVTQPAVTPDLLLLR